MGSDAKKAHEPYEVTPATTAVDEPLTVAQFVHAHTPAGVDEHAGGTQSGAAPVDPADDPAEAHEPAEDPAEAHEPAVATPHALGDALITVPDAVPVGDVNGSALLIGGADLEDSAATLVAYHHVEGPLEVLHTTVTPAAEAKLLEALALTDEHKIPVTVEKEVDGQLPLDTTHGLHQQLATVAKSVNHHLKAGDAIPEHTHANHAALTAQLDELDNGQATEAEQAMLAAYRAAADDIALRLDPGYDTAYAAGGKIPHIHPHQVTATVTVTEMVPAPVDAPADGRLAASVRTATRIDPDLHDGTTSWDGKQRSTASGHEYVIDLGEGYTAVYRPHAAAHGRKDPAYSHRGALEIIAPPGGGHGPAMVRRLGQLNLVNRPMSKAEGEWAYLQRNITAQQLGGHPGVAAALATADGLEEATYQQLWSDRADDAIGMNEAQLGDFGRQLLLDAEAGALTHKVAIVRDAVAKATGFSDAGALAASPGYDPTPTQAGGWLQWNRFDVAAAHAKVNAAFGQRGLAHNTSQSKLLDMFRNGGVLACTERRRLMGVKPGVGSSESADMDTGGAQSVFLRVAGPGSGAALYWDDPARLLRRADWYAYNGDHYGAINPSSSKFNPAKLTRDPAKLAKHNGGSNEVMFRNGIDLTGAQAPTRIACASPKMRTQLLAVLAAQGVTHLGGRPVTEVVK
ncbi:MAG: hypothetical protein WD250_17015 [Egibacteraceae bacterium]